MKIEIIIDDNLIKRIKSLFTRKKVITGIFVIFIMSAVIINAADLNLNVFQPKTPVLSFEVNENFDKLKTAIGSLATIDYINGMSQKLESELEKMQANLTALIGNNTPAGTVIAFSGTMDKIKSGYLLCDGRAVSRATYSALFETIGTAWGAGDGSTTFNLPDMRGRFVRGVDMNINGTASGNDPDRESRTNLYNGNTGNNVGSYQGDEFSIHNHGISTLQNDWNNCCSSGPSWTRDDGNSAVYKNTENNGGDETRPKNAYMYYIIKY